jgi:hypothetical protein
VLAAINTVGDKVERLEQRVDQVESGGIRYVESQPEPKADARAVNPDALDPFTRKLWEERTHDTPQDYGGDREPAYNVPLRWYLKNDGTYVQLQGDAKSRAYYVDKGYHCLTPDEVAEYEKLKPGIVAAQREKAHLIGVIRKLIHDDNSLSGHRDDKGEDTEELDDQTVDELRQTWRSLCAETSQPERALPPPKRWRSEGRDRMLDGVDLTPPASRLREFEHEQEHAAQTRRRSERLVEVTPSNARQFN